MRSAGKDSVQHGESIPGRWILFCWTETDSGWETRSATGMTGRRAWTKKVYEVISPEALYERTGIQKQIFNTIYQLMAMKEEQPEALSGAESC